MLPSCLTGVLAEEGCEGRRGQAGAVAAAAADTQVAQWKPGGTQHRRRERGRR